MTLDVEARLADYLDRIERHNGALNVYLDVRAESAKREAAASAARHAKGETLSAIDGAMIAVKANIAVEGLPWHAGIAAYKDQIAEQDAQTVARLKAAGAIILGSVNMEEGALGAVTDNPHFGKTYNPWGDAFTPGGSSGGSGAAVAAQLCDGALGSDTMGSTRVPASYCGICGHKPSRGRVPFDGVMPLSTSLDHVGPMAQSASMLALLDAILADTNPAQPIELSGVTIGRWRFEDHVQIDGEVQASFETALDQLKRAGARIIDITLPRYEFSRSRRDGLIISEIEGFGIHKDALARDPAGFSDTFRALLEYGSRVKPERAETAYRVLETSAMDAADVFERCDLLVSPTTLETAFAFGEPVPATQADLTAFADFAGIPATAVPSGLTGSGLPASIQFMAARGRDEVSLGAAMAFEAVRGAFALPELK